MEKIDAVLKYWFGMMSDDIVFDTKSDTYRKWFKKSDQTDAEIKELFEDEIKKADQGDYGAWEKTPRGRLALIILFDQFTRNIYRGDPRSFALDKKALLLALRSIDDGNDEQLRMFERPFLYMPFMHSEDMKIQEKSLLCFNKLYNDALEQKNVNAKNYNGNLQYAHRHYEIVKKFGRYPHRNEILSRPSTEEEIKFLKQPNSSF